jgi:hypothetical protein
MARNLVEKFKIRSSKINGISVYNILSEEDIEEEVDGGQVINRIKIVKSAVKDRSDRVIITFDGFSMQMKLLYY